MMRMCDEITPFDNESLEAREPRKRPLAETPLPTPERLVARLGLAVGIVAGHRGDKGPSG